ncbi:hypothetical protein [Lentibacillus sp. CBA3610]|uniref:coiled-coil domain-containing protein n=1 Tax=Lentibacillus sp. CBA3610 TaxID=2518176 RepID=UPI0015951A5E|nr:hypothetical protein [Lentibacillus sp. CBA3610]QKY70225.1 hypothetical protein Len3610_12020 [Lentibacillus sp. CBA3610]
MNTLIVISMIFVLLGLSGYLFSHSRLNRTTTKKYLPILTFALFLSILSGCGMDTTAELDEEVEKNEELTSKITELENSNSSLQEEYDELESQFDELTEEVEQLNNENESIKSENEKLYAEIDELENSNDELQQQLDKKQDISASSNSSASTSTGGSSEGSSDSTQSTRGCDIKGSVNGIYHTPGSTYYNQTKNVAQWFCSEEEAQDAGYRAPKR